MFAASVGFLFSQPLSYFAVSSNIWGVIVFVITKKKHNSFLSLFKICWFSFCFEENAIIGQFITIIYIRVLWVNLSGIIHYTNIHRIVKLQLIDLASVSAFRKVQIIIRRPFFRILCSMDFLCAPLIIPESVMASYCYSAPCDWCLL